MTERETYGVIVKDLRNLGISEGSLLLVHISLRSLGELTGGAKTVLKALQLTIGSTGTLLVPSLSYETVGVDHPVFDIQHTPSCIGVFPEYFRIHGKPLRSIHPTHSVCGIGPKAAYLLKDHELDTTPCGNHSPFYKLGQVGGQILFLGCGMKPNTSMHAIEECVEPPYLYGDDVTYRMIMASGREMSMRVRSHSFSGWIQRYDRLKTLLSHPDIREGKVLDGHAELVNSRAMWVSALSILRKDAFFFVDRMPA